MQIIKGMVQVLGTTYRIVRVRHGSYEVTRIHDEAVVGCFDCGQIVQVTAHAIDSDVMRQIARAAVQQGRTSWMGAAQRPS
jgi:hypothetical protein